jgi:ribosome recycling factor
MEVFFEQTEAKMKKSLLVLNEGYVSIRAGRANPEILNKITIDYYGTPTPINQIASVSVAESRILIIQPWDISLLNAIERAIHKSDLGLNPQSDGKVVRIIFPQLTQSRREEISKEISKMAQNCKVSVRSIRRDAMDKLKIMQKNSEITEDEAKFSEKRIQDLTDKFCAKTDEVCATKINQIMEI